MFGRAQQTLSKNCRQNICNERAISANFHFCHYKIVHRKVQGVPPSQISARQQEKAKIDETRTKTDTCKTNKQMHEKHIDQLPLSQAR